MDDSGLQYTYFDGGPYISANVSCIIELWKEVPVKKFLGIQIRKRKIIVIARFKVKRKPLYETTY